MFTMAVFLAVLSTAIEMYAVLKWNFLFNLLTKYTKLGLIFSFSLSYLLGTMFGAGGLITMTAAVLSTVFSLFIYENNLLSRKDEISAGYKVFKKNLVGTVILAWKIITAPFRFLTWCHNQYARAKRGLERAKRATSQVTARAKRAHS